MNGRPTLTLRGLPKESEPALPACPNPKCVELRQRYPKCNSELIHVQPTHTCRSAHIPGSIVRCGNCGGYWDGQRWIYRCLKCHKDVGPDDLRGMWVPHSCEPCENADIAAQKARGAICQRCQNVFSYCYC